jgi:hypothetical protein
MLPVFILFFIVAILCFALWQKNVRAQREAHIRSFFLPKGLYEKLQAKHPQLTLKECELVGRGLRQYFLAYLKGGKKYVSMPSQVVDDLWHEFILYTKSYEVFCTKAFGEFMHHTPAASLSAAKQSNSGLRRCWVYACKEELIDPIKPTRLPLLFALDAKLSIVGGFVYAPDCSGFKRDVSKENTSAGVHCGGDFSSASFDGGTEGFDGLGNDGSSSDGGGDGGGCGGGCGGGGD